MISMLLDNLGSAVKVSVIGEGDFSFLEYFSLGAL